MATYRQIFGQFKRSYQGRELKSFLYREQRFTCPSCGVMKEMKEMDIHHMKPLSLLEKEQDLINVTNVHNLILLCGKCNRQQSNKVDERFI
jgi:5-methylcytosine-specific restriction endonuclease McrA